MAEQFVKSCAFDTEQYHLIPRRLTAASAHVRRHQMPGIGEVHALAHGRAWKVARAPARGFVRDVSALKPRHMSRALNDGWPGAWAAEIFRAAKAPARSMFDQLRCCKALRRFLGPWNHYGPANRRKAVLAQPLCASQVPPAQTAGAGNPWPESRFATSAERSCTFA